jgi:hypothetical protein
VIDAPGGVDVTGILCMWFRRPPQAADKRTVNANNDGTDLRAFALSMRSSA